MNLDEKHNDPAEIAAALTQGESYKSMRKSVNAVVIEFLDQLDSNGVVHWNRSNDPVDIVKKIARFAELSGRLRGVIPTVGVNGRYEKSFPEIENSSRFTVLLYNLARGRALIHGRSNINDSDLAMCKRIALSSCYSGRYHLLKFLLENDGEAETYAVEELLECSKTTALDLMKTLETLGVLKFHEKKLAQGGKTKCVKLKKEYRDLLLPRSP